MSASTERSLGLFSVYFPLTRAAFHAPVFFLFLSARFSIDDVLRLSAIYYLAVVLLEVPSGYLSDRIGRVATLRVASFSRAVSYALFIVGGTTFELHALAEIAMALHWASLSGTDTSFHFDSLKALDRSSEYDLREAKLARNGYASAAVSVLVGGAVALIDLRAAYILGFVSSIAAFVVALGLHEPSRGEGGFTHEGMIRQIGLSLKSLGDPVLAWVFAYVVAMLVLEHVPYEFTQPYVALVLGEVAGNVEQAPFASGLLFAGFYGIAAWVAFHSIDIRSKIGVGGALIGLTALQTAIIAAMAAIVSPIVLPLLMLRAVQPAVSQVIVNTTCSPRIPPAQRATYYSIQSLSGRLAYGLLLVGLAGIAGDRATADADTLSQLLTACAAVAFVALIALFVTRGALRSMDETHASETPSA